MFSCGHCRVLCFFPLTGEGQYGGEERDWVARLPLPQPSPVEGAGPQQGARVVGLMPSGPASIGRARLAGLVAAGKLKPTISVEAPWTQIVEVAQQLLDRSFPGKAVLHVAD